MKLDPITELLEQAKMNRKKGIHVISTEFVIRKLSEYMKSNAV